MTKGQLLATADSRELTEWQAYLTAVAQEEAEAKTGAKTIKWNVDD